MKIKTILIFIFLSITIAGTTQNRKVFRLGTFGQMTYISNDIIPQYGISAEIFVTNNISLNYKYAVGIDQNGEINGHINPSIFLLPFAYSYEAFLGILLIPEGVSYHFFISDYLELAPYINPLSAEVNLYDNKPLLLSGAIGLNTYLNKATPINDLSIGINCGMLIIYGDGTIAPTLGFSLNYIFK